MKLHFLYIGIIILMTLSVALIFDVFIAFAIFILASAYGLFLEVEQMNNNQFKVIKEIYNTLQKTIEDKSTEYKHKIKDGNNEWIETVNREQNLEAFIEWTLQQIENNFDYEEENINELGNQKFNVRYRGSKRKN